MATITLTDPGADADICTVGNQTLFSSATHGDIIQFPTNGNRYRCGGSFTNSNLVKVTGNCTLYRHSSMSDASLLNAVMMYMNPNLDSTLMVGGKEVRLIVDGINFESKDPATTSAQDFGLRIDYCVGFIVRNCDFSYFGYAATRIYHKDYLAKGVIWNCNYYTNAKQTGLGLGYSIQVSGQDLVWVANSNFGSDNFITIEDCYFEQSRHAVASNGGALFRVRYCTDLNNGVQKNVDRVTHTIDTHASRNTGLGAGNEFSTRAFECYNNTFSHTLYFDGTSIPGSGVDTSKLVGYTVFYRGGAGLVYNNSMLGTEYGMGMYIDALPFGTSVPLPYAPGYLSSLKYGPTNTGVTRSESDDDVWFWNNTKSSYATLFINIHSAYLTSDAQYHNVAAAPSWYTEFPYPYPGRSADF